ncbi:uncharacterized protein BX664DRAFT_208269 [Halteromyces radiatus]|uniref:uncharacterized protein n=1 Tax=Halteromyces radiatus TaxID=101107 RepID=UPI00221F4673|nr:uncharacterized protein BX664DRAFT_208269 [Halteromyces radiatus]KAI8080071.1 hypothetical protein BX664DRAFT_208269 [Halteromyces radiatus]
MSSAFESFVAVHQYQLGAIPEELWQPLFMKLGEDYLDAGSVMELHYGEPLEGYSLHLKSDSTGLDKHSDIYLIDHAWTTTPETARKELRENEALLERLENMMDVEKEEGWVDEDESDEEMEHNHDIISMVAEQANVSFEKAKQALIDENYEVVNAIANLTIDPEFQKKADELQDQVLGQLIASGKAQEKEDKVKIEKEEKKKQWIQDWMERRVSRVYNKMWSFIQTYSYTVLKTDGQSAAQTALYVNDEVGSAICHSTEPNMMCVPFIFSRGASGMIPYSILFPIRSIKPGDLISCDLLPKAMTDRQCDKTAYLYAFKDRISPQDQQLLADSTLIKEAYEVFAAALDSNKTIKHSDIDNKITQMDDVQAALSSSSSTTDITKVFTDIDCVRLGLTLDNIQWVSSPDQADFVWTRQQQQHKFSNEQCLTHRGFLSQLLRQTYGIKTDDWYPTVYDLKKELAECVGDHLHRLTDQQIPFWLTQPYEDDHSNRRIITSLPELIRQYDTPMIPQSAQRYITRPCLYNGKKFHLRFIVALRHLASSPPTWLAAVYNNKFWVRLANKKYKIDDVEDMDRQYLSDSGYSMTSLDHTSFIRHMEKENVQWKNIKTNIYKVIKGNRKKEKRKKNEKKNIYSYSMIPPFFYII